VYSSIANFNSHTLVQHPVGLHKDVFGKRHDGTPLKSLENKTVFCHAGLFSKYGVGRGGYGHGKFAFAILDWGSGGRSRNAVRRQTMLLATGEAPARMSESIWADFAIRFPEAAATVS